jgi:uncharacterized membrane protein YtjA (UPF0391 family)
MAKPPGAASARTRIACGDKNSGTFAAVLRNDRCRTRPKEELAMLKLALFFLVVSIIAGVFGFTGISAASAGIAKILFLVFVVLFVVFVILALMAGKAIL